MNTTDKELLMLGILRFHQSHGYELNAILQNPTMPIQIGKANAYQILNRFVERGWVTSTEEQEGNRPLRRVYTVNEEGEKVFQRLLRERLATHVPSVQADAVSLNFLDLVPRDEALELLAQRLEALKQQLAELQGEAVEGADVHYGYDFMLKHAEFELNWTEGLITKLSADT